jgi:transcriptional regulator with XRE-family HTH domain
MAVVSEALRPDTGTRILDAALRAVSTFGLSRFTMDDVARAADVSRQTVYRYFASKDELIVALVYREEEAFLDGVRDAFQAHADLEAAIERAMRYCLRAVREHPLLDRLLASEPEVLLPYLTTRGGRPRGGGRGGGGGWRPPRGGGTTTNRGTATTERNQVSGGAGGGGRRAPPRSRWSGWPPEPCHSTISVAAIPADSGSGSDVLLCSVQ